MGNIKGKKDFILKPPSVATLISCMQELAINTPSHEIRSYVKQCIETLMEMDRQYPLPVTLTLASSGYDASPLSSDQQYHIEIFLLNVERSKDAQALEFADDWVQMSFNMVCHR